jgi:hypothetical protein
MFTRIRRFVAVLAAAASGLLASAAIVPAAFATVTPIGNDVTATTTGFSPVPATTVHVIVTGGMAGWQITSIALGSAVIAAAAAVLLYRTLAARRRFAATA